jgi:peptidoglycan hydrolase-like protein with peptidoglycan-binding domain
LSVNYESLVAGDFQKTTFDGGLEKLVKIWEALRELNTGGYGSGILVTIGDWHPAYGGGKTDCSPFTATAIAMALDPDFTPGTPKDKYAPVFDGGQPLGKRFYHLHNGFSLSEYQNKDPKSGKVLGWRSDFAAYAKKLPQLTQGGFGAINDSAGSIVAFNLGERVPWTQMRRGDLLGMDWNNKEQTGHAAFCWNVHVNGAGEVDAFQIIAANSAGHTGAGITVYTYAAQVMDKSFLSNTGGKYQKLKEMFTPILADPNGMPEYTPTPNVWFGVPKVKKSQVDLTSFGVDAGKVNFVEAGSSAYSVGALRVARLFGITPPEPYLISGKTVPKAATVPPAPPVAKVTSKKADAPPKPPEKAAPAAQDFQTDVEIALQLLWNARWISLDPGNSKDVNDAASQAAIKDYQQKFMAGAPPPQLGHADPETRKRIARAAGSAMTMPLVGAALQYLFKNGQLATQPGDDPAKLDEKNRAAVKEFQKKNGLEVDGIPGPNTQSKLAEAMKAAQQQTAPAVQQQTATPAAASTGAAASTTPTAGVLFYWVPAYGAPGAAASLKVANAGAYEGQTCPVGLYDANGGAIQENLGSITIAGGKGSLDVAIPIVINPGTALEARLTEGFNAVTKARFQVSKAGGPIAVVDGENIYLDPPVRLYPQWDPRWADRRVGGPDMVNTNWQGSGCCPSSAAMILRWFAEDCKAGRVAFPALDGTKISAAFYGPRMAQKFWPDGFDYYRKGKFAAKPDRPGNPDGKVELNNSGVDFNQLFDKAAKWLGKDKAYYTDQSGGDWMAVIRKLLAAGPCILGLGAPAGHFVVAQGIKNGALLIVDPGNVLYQAVLQSGNKEIANWNGYKSLELEAGKPPASQWPGGSLPAGGTEDSKGAYVAASGTVLKSLLAGIKWIHSLSYPDGPAFTGQAAAAPAAASTPAAAASGPATGKVEVFFNYKGWIGPAYNKTEGYDKNKKYTYVGYRVPGKTAWFLRGRGNVDVDGAPNAYHPSAAMNKNFVHAGELATYDVSRLDRPLEYIGNGPTGLQTKDGKLYVQNKADFPDLKDGDAFAEGFHVMHTPLRRNQYKAYDPREYADARYIPYFAIPTQVLGQAASASSLPGFTGWEKVGDGHTGNVGDYVTAVNLNPGAYKGESYPPGYLNLLEIGGKKYPIAHGMIGDAGNQPHIGECSYAFAKSIHTLNGPEWADVLWMIHPGSGKGPFGIPAPADIQATGQKLFDAWGGKDQLSAVLALAELKSNGK